MKHLYISNLNSLTTEEDIRGLFTSLQHISVGRVRTVRNSYTEAIATFAYVSIDDEPTCASAMQLLNATTLHGNRIEARMAR